MVLQAEKFLRLWMWRVDQLINISIRASNFQINGRINELGSLMFLSIELIQLILVVAEN